MSGQDTKQQIGVGSLTMFMICAVIVLDTLTASAAIGPSAFAWWGIMLIGFVLPYTLVVTELGTTWPAEGGIYDWVKRAFGDRMAARTSYLYWINVGLWMPSVYILFAGTFASLYWPGMNINWQILMCLALTWLTVWFCNISTTVCISIARWGAWAKIIVIVTLGIAGINQAIQHGLANDLQLHNLIPHFNEASHFLPAIIYSLLGLELVACMGKLIKKPEKTMPRAMLAAALLIALLYLFGTLGILAALPVDKISLVSGIIDALKILFGQSLASKVMLNILCLLTLFTFISNMVTWTSGSSRAAAEAAQSGDLPKPLGKRSKKFDTPVGANIATGLVSTLVILCYSQFASGNNDLFWLIFSFSSCIFLLPYFLLFTAWFWLRYSAPQVQRPYRVPGGKPGQWLVVSLGLLFILQGVVLFIFPDLLEGKIEAKHSLPIITGLAVTLLIGELCLLRFHRKTLRTGI
ncbi:APC family permease [Rouxiella sp. Mn2063]|uniref:APC family permease n=1 Tax=Rouxiella sp. Mn2063 TaxID=3395262 RepID=UPI003BBF4523